VNECSFHIRMLVCLSLYGQLQENTRELPFVAGADVRKIPGRVIRIGRDLREVDD
ncbi:hypothetical protein O181_069178, partial [Austropuccinia psidii MF-1]|nr:hypothetical protein [Austropuccinia psidii MF-1]